VFNAETVQSRLGREREREKGEEGVKKGRHVSVGPQEGLNGDHI